MATDAGRPDEGARPSRRALLTTALLAPGIGWAAPVAPAPYGATPSMRQLAWHRLEAYGFVHFSINTFTDREWGYGDESPALFDPTDFSADQIAAAAKAGGLRGLILTAKHHDGFCLWPSRFTEHSVRNSPYKKGRGDIVAEMAAACARAGLKFGIYLSPWDRNHPEYGRPAYLTYYRNQLRELLTQYGPLFEVWFDGANGGDGYYGGARETRKITRDYYDWPSIIALVHALQPGAVTFEPKGSDVRWVGNEEGHAGDPCWATMDDGPYTRASGHGGVRGGPVWWPAEVDVSIRPGWFWHAHETAEVKSPDRLQTIYFESVGRGANLLLNLPPDRRGRIPDEDARALAVWGEARRKLFATDLARGARVQASATRPGYPPMHVLDGSRDTFWACDVSSCELVLTLPTARVFDVVRLREHLPLGLRVSRFALDIWDGDWREIARRQGIGAQRLVRLDRPVTTSKVRLRVLDAPAGPAISEIGLFLQPLLPKPPVAPAERAGSALGWRIAEASAAGAEVLIDGEAGTAWRAPLPCSVVIDLGLTQRLAGFTLLPAKDRPEGVGAPSAYRLATSLDTSAWTPAGDGEFSNIAASLAPQRIAFGARDARYVRLEITRAAGGEPQVAFAGLDLVAAVVG